ncbi:PREDICTED: serine/threonine-protein kinase/endoribonuclease IRE1a-like [Ipomoea nil]|uniref:serine/threonine-protein kinase/endoribonuclease IRE1a-like n=1 Tax=Ipomoea nil TaxID=35883 RepID=UPI000901EE47|nr:PREDICTED: serine/threonine-protein kinase/endoribonuclease IRE1a-like [Ipomoea nil]
MRGFLLYRLFIFILCLALAFGTSLDSEESDSEAELGSSSELPATNFPLSLPPKPETAIVVTPDGMIHLMSSGTILWSFPSGPAIYSSFQDNNLGGYHNLSTEGENFHIDIGEDGKLYLYVNNIKKEELSADEFLKHTPYTLAGRVMLGSKKTTAFLVDSNTGRVIRTSKSDMFGDKEVGENPIMARNDLGDLTMHIMRTDYSFKFTCTKTGKVSWYLHFATFEVSLQSERVDKFLGPTMLPVHIIRDPKVLESFFMSQNALPGVGSLSLPPAVHNLVIPNEKWVKFHQNNEVASQKALPAPLLDEFAIMSLPAGDNQVVIESNFLSGSFFWSFVLFGTLVLLIVAFLFFMASSVKEKWYKLRNQAVDKKIDVMTPKKKKLRKSGINKKSPNSDKGKEKVFTDESSFAHGLPDSGNTENQMQVKLLDRYCNLVDGRKIGKLFVSNKEIAKGSNGTVVLEGIYDGRPVAVKRLVQTHHDIALKEIQNLIASDHHPNIVRWYGVEYDQDFVYLSLERCTCSLSDLVSRYSNSFEMKIYGNDQDPISRSDFDRQGQWASDNNHNVKDFELWKANGYPSPKLLKLLSDIVHGLAHLHELGIIHRDLKPQNVLIVKERPMRAKISDMGISKSLAGDMSSLSRSVTGYGSSGWQAPEQLRHERQTRAVDLFSLGCVLFFCITGGKHPYGEGFERDVNIVNDRKDLFLIENIPEATDLISRLLHPIPISRPTAMEIINHPLFWKPETRLAFLRDASDRVELEDREADSDILKALENIKTEALGGQWDAKLDTAFINDIGRYRRYKFDSVRDLLRVIRNKLNHYRELSKEIQELLGQVPEGFDSYFSSRFPRLVMEVYNVIRIYCGEEETFRIYFKNNHI